MTFQDPALFEPPWQQPGLAMVPVRGGCDLWRVALDAVEGVEAALRGEGSLDEEELARARRFAFAQDTRRFVAARLALRRILAAALGVAPAEVSIEAPRLGRPRLAGPRLLEFNLSHSGGTALVAVSTDGPLGVDVEELRVVPDAAALAARLFTDDEQAELGRAADAARDLRFLTCWTRKEAVLKSTGDGLSVEPQSVEVGAGTAPRELRFAASSGPVSLRVESFPVAPGAIGAIALPAGRRVARWLDGPPA